MDMPRAATMNELAKLAGVSIATVSRALAGNPLSEQPRSPECSTR